MFGLNELNNSVINVIQKPSARKAVKIKADEIKASIDNTPNATDEGKQSALDKVVGVVDDANNKIRQAQSDSEVLVVKTNAIALLQSISTDVQVKPQALEEIHSHAESQKERINVIAEATKEEKDVALQKVDALLKQEQNIINTVSKNHQVNDAKVSSIEEIHKVNPIALVKPQALKDIANQLDAQRNIIKNNQEATIEEKAAAIDKLIKASARIAEAIDNAKANQDADNTKTQSIEEIPLIVSIVDKKPVARQEVQHKAKEIRALINKNKDATQEEKNIAINHLDDIVNKANMSITQASTNDVVDRAKELALPEIQKVSVIAIKKSEAKAQTQIIAIHKQSKLEQNKEATQEEKQVFASSAKVLLNRVQSQISDVYTNE